MLKEVITTDFCAFLTGNALLCWLSLNYNVNYVSSHVPTMFLHAEAENFVHSSRGHGS